MGKTLAGNDTVKYAKETVGIATYIPQKYIRKEVKDKDNFLYTVSAPGSNRFHYYTMFTSCKETFGYPTPEAWFAYMHEWKEELQHPVQVKIKTKKPSHMKTRKTLLGICLLLASPLAAQEKNYVSEAWVADQGNGK